MAYTKKTTNQRQEEIDNAFKLIEEQVPKVFESEHFKEYLSSMSKFHNYSINNILLIKAQRPEASLVAGFNAWKNNFERYVNKGEKAIKILAPSTYKQNVEVNKLDENGNVVKDSNGNPVKETKEIQTVYYRAVSVFDVSQTSGKELPAIAPQLTSDSPEARKLLAAIESMSPAEITYSTPDEDSILRGGAHGYYDRTTDSIVINSELANDQKAKTLIHELAHATLHNEEAMKDTVKSKEQKEIEAESTAFVISNYFGIDTSSYSFDYIAAYSNNKEPKELKDILSNIQKTAHSLIEQIEDTLSTIKVQEQNKEQEPDKGQEQLKQGQEDNTPTEPKQPSGEAVEAPGSNETPEPEANEPSESSTEPQDGPETDFTTSGDESTGKDEEAPESPTEGNTEPSDDTDKKSEGKGKIEDFGEKIGGARKDLWKARGGLDYSDLETMNEAEKLQYINKNNVFPKPDYQALVNDKLLDKEAAYYLKTVRDALPTKPYFSASDKTPEQIRKKQENFIDLLYDVKSKLRDEFYHTSRPDIKGFLEAKGYLERTNSYYGRSGYVVTEKGSGLIDNKLLHALENPDWLHIKRDVENKQFCYTEDEKELALYRVYKADTVQRQMPMCYKDWTETKGSEVTDYVVVKDRKFIQDGFDSYQDAKDFVKSHYEEHKEEIAAGRAAEKKEKKKERSALNEDGSLRKDYVPEMLKNVERTGTEYRTTDATGQDFLDDFSFKGGEFGNWLNDKERQSSLNFAYDSFKDIAKALNITDKDVTLDGQLSIAFGSRGRKGALAHYEPLRAVINLTKMKGAGSLAHEWIHAMDFLTAKKVDLSTALTSNQRNEKVPTSLKDLMHTIKRKTLTVEEVKQEALKSKDDSIERMKRSLNNISVTATDPELKARQDKLKEAVIEEAQNTKDYRYFSITETGRGKCTTVYDEKPTPAFQAFIDFQKQELKDKNPMKNIKWYNAARTNFSNVNAIIEKPEDNIHESNTDFYKAALTFDGGKSKSYWASDVELLARAGAAYIKDKLEEQGIKNDYLCGHADPAGITVKGEMLYQSPRGEEREAINEAFDKFFDEMKELGLLHEPEQEKEQTQSLDDLIAGAVEQVSNSKKEAISKNDPER